MIIRLMLAWVGASALFGWWWVRLHRWGKAG